MYNSLDKKWDLIGVSTYIFIPQAILDFQLKNNSIYAVTSQFYLDIDYKHLSDSHNHPNLKEYLSIINELRAVKILKKLSTF